MGDRIIRALAAGGSFRVFAANTTDMVEKARKIHHLSPVCSAALGRTASMAVIMGLTLKSDNNKISITIKGGGPIGSIVAVADPKGRVKAYVDNPEVDLPLKPNGKLDVAAAVGTDGRLTVIKDLGLREPYVGQVNIVSGEIAEDFAYYFASSEQQPSFVALGVLVEKDGTIRAAGGLLIQAMPGTSQNLIEGLESRLSKIEAVSSLIDRVKDPEKMVKELLEDWDVTVMEQIIPGFICDCSRERLEKVLISLGRDELRDIIDNDEKAQLTCHFCNQVYDFKKEELEQLLEQA